jgi:hypothetical protein
MTNPSPYEQGFRDALLSVKAQIQPFMNHQRGTNSEAEWGAEQIESVVDRLLAQKNQDLWSLLALAQTDLSAYPEAQALRDFLRTPTGVLIDSEGKMLFLRLNGTEYDTGVLGLREEIKKLKLQAAECGTCPAPTNESPWRHHVPAPSATQAKAILDWFVKDTTHQDDRTAQMRRALQLLLTDYLDRQP